MISDETGLFIKERKKERKDWVFSKHTRTQPWANETLDFRLQLIQSSIHPIPYIESLLNYLLSCSVQQFATTPPNSGWYTHWCWLKFGFFIIFEINTHIVRTLMRSWKNPRCSIRKGTESWLFHDCSDWSIWSAWDRIKIHLTIENFKCQTTMNSNIKLRNN